MFLIDAALDEASESSQFEGNVRSIAFQAGDPPSTLSGVPPPDGTQLRETQEAGFSQSAPPITELVLFDLAFVLMAQNSITEEEVICHEG